MAFELDPNEMTKIYTLEKNVKDERAKPYVKKNIDMIKCSVDY